MAPSAKPLLRVMTDANVLVAGNAFPRWPYEVLRHAVAGDYQLYLCPYILNEARRTLDRTFPEHTHRFERFLNVSSYQQVKDPSARTVWANPNLVRSAKDVPVVLAARRARVHYLVTNDKDLTVADTTTGNIRQWFTPVLPAVFLKDAMGWSGDELEAIRHRTWKDVRD